jgi:four helix bundle protein
VKDFKSLKIWQKGIKLVVDIYKLTKVFPQEELYGLTSQMRRSAISIPSNIAEGSGRNSDKDFNRFLDISLGSSFELETQIIIARELEFLSSEDFLKLSDKVQEEQKMITGLQKSLRQLQVTSCKDKTPEAKNLKLVA